MSKFLDVILKFKILYWWLVNSFTDWKREVWVRDLDATYCCDGLECGCQGASVRDMYARKI